MTAQDLSLKELKTCALLYSIKHIEGVLLDSQILSKISLPMFSIIKATKNDSIIGRWYGRPFCIVPQNITKSLILKGLLIPQEEHNQKFYVLDIRKEFKDFFKELEVQIALGSII